MVAEKCNNYTTIDYEEYGDSKINYTNDYMIDEGRLNSDSAGKF